MVPRFDDLQHIRDDQSGLVLVETGSAEVALQSVQSRPLVVAALLHNFIQLCVADPSLSFLLVLVDARKQVGLGLVEVASRQHEFALESQHFGVHPEVVVRALHECVVVSD